MKRLLLASIAVAGLAMPAAADDDTGAANAAPVSDVQDLVFVRGGRPLLLRLHVRIDGTPFAGVWEGYIDQLFAHLDVNGDGVLDQAEGSRAPRAQSLIPNQRGRGFFGQFAAVDFKELQPEDGKVTRAKLGAYYRRAGFAKFQVMTDAAAAAEAAALGDALFKALDRDGDGKLSKDEIRQAAESLRRFDVDDDETISVQELAPAGAAIPFRQPQRQAGSDALVAVDTHDAPALAAKLLEVFDKDKNKKLTRAEIGLDETRFGELDTDGDGELDADELARFAKLAPDGEFAVSLGRLGSGEAAVVPTASRGLPVKKAGEGLEVTMGTLKLDLRRGSAQGGATAVPAIRQFLVQQFKGLAGKDGFVEQKALQGNARLLGPIFPLADRDGDGKLTEKELTAFLDVTDKANTAIFVLTVADQSRALFDTLDTRRDGRLRFHELPSAWDRLAAWDREGKGFLTRADIPAKLELSVARGQPNPFVRLMAARPGPQQRQGPAEPDRGPLWFRKMDRNGDGVVSRREWLGAVDDFKRFDLNGDGVIDLGEAEKADVVLRGPDAQKP